MTEIVKVAETALYLGIIVVLVFACVIIAVNFVPKYVFSDKSECVCHDDKNVFYYGFNLIHDWKTKFNVSTCEELCRKNNMTVGWNTNIR